MPRSKSSDSKRFGFNTSQPHRAVNQLRDLLQLDQFQFVELKETFRRITRKHFDLDKVGSSQPQALRMAIDDLKSQLPHWFKKGNIEQREFFAMRIFLIFHTRHRKNRPANHRTTSTSSGNTRKCSITVPTPRQSTPRQSTPRQPTPGGSQIRSVHKFLEAATPSMTHLLHRFIEFGCLSEEFLFAVSMWPQERIRLFLKNLPPGAGGSALTKMEMDILAYHFESYFLTSSSKE